MRTSTRRAIPGLYGGSGKEIFTGWWDLGDGTCLGAWTPKTAASLADSYFDETGNGNDLTVVDGTPGWTVNSGLHTGACAWNTGIDLSRYRSAMVYFYHVNGVGGFTFGQYDSSGTYDVDHYFRPDSGSARRYGVGTSESVTTGFGGDLSTGTYTTAVCHQKGYTNGGYYALGVWSGTYAQNCFIGAANNDQGTGRTDYAKSGGRIHAFAIWDRELTQTEVQGLRTLLLAL